MRENQWLPGDWTDFFHKDFRVSYYLHIERADWSVWCGDTCVDISSQSRLDMQRKKLATFMTLTI